MKWSYLLLAVAMILSSCQRSGPSFENFNVVDLTYPFEESTVYWPTEEGFIFQKVFEGKTDQGFYYANNKFRAGEHGGTHIDAPIHFFPKRNTVDKIPLKQLMGTAVLIDVSKRALKNPDYQIFAEDLLEWEKNNGRIPQSAIVLLRTGYGIFYPDPKKYLGTEEKGEKAVSKLHFPGLHPEAARWLLQHRDIKAVGIDTPSIDYGQSKSFHTHQVLFEENVPALENLANLHQLPDRNFSVIALPMKIAGGSGGPTRVVAFIPEEH